VVEKTYDFPLESVSLSGLIIRRRSP
jgi:hypothetical protein